MQYNISVIVPVYNTADFIVRCINSVLAQSLPVQEVILVDDGSTDESGRVCDELAAKNKLVRVIHQSNAGPNAARKAGVLAASGNLIAFIDSDDAIHPEMYSLLAAKLANNPGCIPCCGFFSTSMQKIHFPNLEKPVHWKNYFGTSRFQALLRNSNMMLSLNNKLYPRIVFDEIDFGTELRSHEDLYVNLQIFSKIDKVSLCLTPLYAYYYRPGSLSTRTTTKKQLDDMLWVAEYFCKISEKDISQQELAQSCYSERLIYSYTLLARGEKAGQDKAEKKRLADLIKSRKKYIYRDKAMPAQVRAAGIAIIAYWPVYDTVVKVLTILKKRAKG